ncbi:hypothetical protein CBG03_08815 [Streptococcus pyogenes]|nr:hypothetical protein CBG03_08815 [Streptococcus pyogenes]
MSSLLLLILVVGGGAWFLSSRNGRKQQELRESQRFEDAMADARRWTERLGGQVLTLKVFNVESR